MFICICVFCPFSLFLFLVLFNFDLFVFVLTYCILFNFIIVPQIPVCFLRRDRKGMDLYGGKERRNCDM